jgi:ParB family chromosome partitioning protein
MTAYREVIARALSTRETEKLVKNLKLGGRRRRESPAMDPDLRSLVEDLQRALGTKIRVLPKARSNKGKIEIEYYSLADLERIIGTITVRSSSM